MKILFVYPNITRVKSPQLGICMIAAIARKYGHESDLYDLTTIPKGEEVSCFRSKLEAFKPEILAVSCRSNEWPFVKELFASVKTDNIFKVFGGPHTTVNPQEVVEIADIVVLGEGEETFSELLQKIADKEDTAYTPGCWVKKEDRVFKNEMRNLISDLNDLPLPFWEIFDKIHIKDSDMKFDFPGTGITGVFECSRGCPYACSYCTNDYVRTLYKGKGKWRREKSAERIIEEIKTFRSIYGLDGVYFIDEVILTKVSHLEEFRDLYRSEIEAPFIFMERPENMIDKKVRLIKQAGAIQVSIGIESGDEKIRRNLLNRHHSQETIISAFQTAKKHGLKAHAFTMVGFPGESNDSIKQTYMLLKRARPDTVQTTIFFPLKGTKLNEKAVKEGLFDQSTQMQRNYYDGSSLKFSADRKNELKRWQYILTNYNSMESGLYLLTFPGRLAFPAISFFRKLYDEFSRKGFISTMKTIMRKITFNMIR